MDAPPNAPSRPDSAESSRPESSSSTSPSRGDPGGPRVCTGAAHGPDPSRGLRARRAPHLPGAAAPPAARPAAPPARGRPAAATPGPPRDPSRGAAAAAWRKLGLCLRPGTKRRKLVLVLVGKLRQRAFFPAEYSSSEEAGTRGRGFGRVGLPLLASSGLRAAGVHDFVKPSLTPRWWRRGRARSHERQRRADVRRRRAGIPLGFRKWKRPGPPEGGGPLPGQVPLPLPVPASVPAGLPAALLQVAVPAPLPPAIRRQGLQSGPREAAQPQPLPVAVLAAPPRRESGGPRPQLLPRRVRPEPVHHREGSEGGVLQVRRHRRRLRGVRPAVRAVPGLRLRVLRKRGRRQGGQGARQRDGARRAEDPSGFLHHEETAYPNPGDLHGKTHLRRLPALGLLRPRLRSRL